MSMRGYFAVCLMLSMTGITLAQEALIGYWQFDQGQGDMALDSTFLNDGQINGASWLPGKMGTALEFDGSAYVDCGSEAGNGITDALSLAAWIMPDDFGNWRGIITKGTSVGSPYSMQLWGTGALRFGVNTGTTVNSQGDRLLLDSTTLMTSGVWTHVAVTFGDNTVSLYINGEVSDTFDAPIVLGAIDEPLIIGCDFFGGDEYFDGLIDEAQIYDRKLTPLEVKKTMSGAVTGIAYFPTPAHGKNDVPRDGLDLGWAPGKGAAFHDIYLGTTLEDVENATINAPRGALLRAGHDANSIGLARLPFDTAHYWRVDEVTADGSRTKGDIWRFTVEPRTILISDVRVMASGADAGKEAQGTIDGSGLNANGHHNRDSSAMWQSTISAGAAQPQIQYTFGGAHPLEQVHVWNHNSQFEALLGYGIKDLLIEYSLDSQQWTEFRTVQLSQASAKTDYGGEVIALDGIVASSVRFTALSNWSKSGLKTYGLSEVRFEAIPTLARELSPEDGAAVSDVDVTLSWRSGRYVSEHQVFLDVRENTGFVEASDAGSLAATLPAQGPYGSHTASGLDLAESYVWKIVEVNEAQPHSAYSSTIQRFRTPDYLVLDDMEVYADREFFEIWAHWLDGTEFGTDDRNNGSIVGADPADNDYDVASGLGRGQSLPIWIDNTATPYSEATRFFDPPEDWTQFRITSLSLWVLKGAATMSGSLYVKINDNTVPLVDDSTYPAGFDPGWVQYALDLTGLNVSSVASLAVGVDGANAEGVIYVDDIRHYAGSPRVRTLTLVGSVIEAERGPLSGHFVVQDEADASGGQYIVVPGGSYPNSNDKPVSRSNGWAVYSLNIPADGEYVIAFLGLNEVAGDGDDSLWVHIPGALHNDAVQSPEAVDWLLNENLFDGPQDSIVWDFVHDDHEDVTDPVIFTLTAGIHELQISHREGGTGLDAIAVFAID